MKLTWRFDAALVYASCLHANQVRKGTEIPYISHLLAVTSLVMEHGGDEDETIAALLHDAVEDQGGQDTLAVIRARFGDRVAQIVEGCSDACVRPKPPWRERKEHHIACMEAALPSVRLVTLADKLHNARTVLADYRLIGESLWKRFNGGREGTLWYYRSMIDVMRKFGASLLLEELDRTVSELEKLAGAKA